MLVCWFGLRAAMEGSVECQAFDYPKPPKFGPYNYHVSHRLNSQYQPYNTPLYNPLSIPVSSLDYRSCDSYKVLVREGGVNLPDPVIAFRDVRSRMDCFRLGGFEVKGLGFRA